MTDQTFSRPEQIQHDLSKIAMTILEKRYLIKDAAGKPVEGPLDMFWRVATTMAKIESRYNTSVEEQIALARRFYAMMVQRIWEPNSPTLMNAGRPLGQLSACFVLPVDDALKNGQTGIYDTLTSMAIIHQSGGGTGFSFSRIRPKGSMVKSTTGVASGPVSFMALYDASTEAVKQGGCVVPDTLVSTDRGIVPIRDLGPSDESADSWHAHSTPLRVSTDAEPQASDEFYVHGVAPVRRIRTESGYRLAATHQHRIRVIDASGQYVWRRMDELAQGDWVVLQKGHMMEPTDMSLPPLAVVPHPNATEVRFPTVATRELGEFLGYLIGDGAFNRYNAGGTTRRVILTVADSQPEVAQWLLVTTQSLFGLTPLAQKKPDDASTNYFLNATALGLWLEQIGVQKPSAHEARVPDVVFRRGPEFARGFLRGLFTADGTASTEGYPSLSSVSPDLIDGVQQLLLAVGIPSAQSVVTDRESAYGDRPLHRLRVTTQAGREVFEDTIGFIDTLRQNYLPAGRDKAWERGDVIPNAGSHLKAAYAGVGRGSGPGRGSRGANRALYRDVQHYMPGVQAARQLSRSRLVHLSKKHEAIGQSAELNWFLSHDQFYDQVAEIVEGESLTLDLSVPVNNTYVANGFVSHNTRRGANMGVLRVDHPDIMDFITCKEDLTKILNFNISVAVTDVFMDALAKGESYDLVNPANGQVTGQLDARTVFDSIVVHAWSTGEPGVLFLDEANRHNPVPALGLYEATNPCGEQFLQAFDVCNLGSLNLSYFIDKGAPGDDWKSRIRWDEMREYVHLSTRFLDNVIDANNYPLEQITTLARNIRRIGNGVMGYADALIQLGIGYNTAEGVEVGEAFAKFFHEECQAASVALAESRGTFPAWPESIWGPDETCARDANGERIRPMMRLRNCNVNTVAPTGTISIIAGCSSGIEPLFAIAFMRNQAGSMMADANVDFVARAKAEGWYSDDLMVRIAKAGNIHFPEVPEAVQRVFVTAHDIAPSWHIDHQAAWQRHVDSSISKTTNFPNSATQDDVREIYMRAYQAKLKGVTVYRDGSRQGQVLSTGATTGQATAPVDTATATKLEQAERRIEAMGLELLEARAAHRRVKRARPDELTGRTRRVLSPLGDLFVTLNVDDKGTPFEMLASLGKAGGAAAADVEAIARLISLALRSGIPIEEIHKQLRGISSDKAVGFGPSKVLSVPDGMAQAIERMLTAAQGVQQELPLSAGAQVTLFAPVEDTDMGLMVCDSCGSAGSLEKAEGCLKCHACGASKCG